MADSSGDAPAMVSQCDCGLVQGFAGTERAVPCGSSGKAWEGRHREAGPHASSPVPSASLLAGHPAVSPWALALASREVLLLCLLGSSSACPQEAPDS